MLGSLSLDQLKILVTVDRTGSFSAAAHALGRAQSAISQAVRSLEYSQDVVLFDRSGRKPTLTDAGRVLLLRAQQVLAEAELFESTARSIRADIEPELTVAMDAFVPSHIVFDSLAAFCERFPNVAVTVLREGIWSVERRVLDGSATLGFCILSSRTQDFETRYMASIHLRVMVAPTHPLATARHPITARTLSQHIQLILTDPFNPAGQSYSIVSPRQWRFVDMNLRLEALVRGIGWANMPEHLVAREIAENKLVEVSVSDPIANPPDEIPILGIHLRNRPLRTAASWLLNDLKEHFEAERE